LFWHQIASSTLCSNLGKNGLKLEKKRPTAEFIFEGFGNACKHFNANASHFSKHVKLHLTYNGKLSDIKTLH